MLYACKRMSDSKKATKRLRSEEWFNNPAHPDGTVIYIERFLNYGITPEELRAGKPIIGIAQVGSDITPCNRGHIETVERVKAGIRDLGGFRLCSRCTRFRRVAAGRPPRSIETWPIWA